MTTPEQFAAIRDLLAIYGAMSIAATVTFLAWLFWTPKYTECFNCRALFKPSHSERTAAVIDGPELRPLCPYCKSAETLLAADRDFSEQMHTTSNQ